MKAVLTKIFLLIFALNISCKSQDFDFRKDVKLQNSLNEILSTFVKNELDTHGKYNPDKDKLILFLDVTYRDSLIRNSNIHLNIDFWSKEYADIYDAEYRFKGVDIIFDENNYNYVEVFKLKKKTEKEKRKTKKIIKKTKEIGTTSKVRLVVTERYTHAFAQINAYLNLNNEVTYFDSKERIYYDLLKDKIKFNEQFWDKIEFKTSEFKPN